ncbi:MAG: PDZ domain-containing protein [Verrucomicrobiaceae bacterium]|nr:PDZ domain-containing protein [Verrucomicrobiaceae bacterium]
MRALRYFLLLAGLTALSVWSVDSRAEEPGDDADSGFKEIELFTEVLETIRQGYVDSDKVTYEKLINSALEGMLADLDPHCQFMQPKVFEQLKRHTDSTYEGIGVTISTKNDVLTIVTAREDGPAARAGILPGDQILKINKQLTEDLGIAQAVNMLKGKPGEPILLTIRRPATQKLHEFEMKREIIKQSSVKDARILDPQLTAPYRMGYARILQFSEPTAVELADALDKLEQEGMDAFVLDMRNNPGGLLNSAIDVCGEFVKAGTVVLTTEGKPGSGEIKIYRTNAEAKRRDRDYPLAILVNHSSASGAEVVSGALQDLKRCIVVGETTFGKGSVQSIIPIGEGKAIRMTTAKYYTPSHRTIHENGVIPNIVAPLTPAQEQALAKWFGKDTLPPEERKKLENFSDPQLTRAVDAMKGALVYSSIRKGEAPSPVASAAEEKKTMEPGAEPAATEPEEKKATEKPAAKPESKPEAKPASETKTESKPDAEDKPAPAAAPSTPDTSPE